jgi:hypothetical protein
MVNHKPQMHTFSFLPGILFLVFVLMLTTAHNFPWWLFVIFFVIHQGKRACAFPTHTLTYDKRKRVSIGDVEKRKNDDLDDEPEYIRTRDGQWLEIID